MVFILTNYTSFDEGTRS